MRHRPDSSSALRGHPSLPRCFTRNAPVTERKQADALDSLPVKQYPRGLPRPSPCIIDTRQRIGPSPDIHANTTRASTAFIVTRCPSPSSVNIRLTGVRATSLGLPAASPAGSPCDNGAPCFDYYSIHKEMRHAVSLLRQFQVGDRFIG